MNEDQARPTNVPQAERERQATDASFDLEEAFRSSRVGEILVQMDHDLIGLVPVKTRVYELAVRLLGDLMREKSGLPAERAPLHMAFMGPLGTGKTTVAARLAQVLHRTGSLRKGQLIAVERDDLVSRLAGHTAPMTREVLKRAMGGVLFIDEAHTLFDPANEADFGREALDLILAAIGGRDDLAVVFAGDKQRTEAFLFSNPILRSRVNHFFEFPSYSAEELITIARAMLGHLNYEFTPAADQAFQEYIALRLRQPQFANARSVRNALDRARLRQAVRLYENAAEATVYDLRVIDEVDIRASRAFGEPAA